MAKTPKRKKTVAKDSPFTLIFKEEEYVVDLYEEITGIRFDPATIKSIRLENALVTGRLYNDVAFLTADNHLLILIEHQSTLNRNMIFRLVEYYIALASRYITETKQNKFGSKELAFPKAELYVVYNGKGIMADLPVLDLGYIQAKAKVTNIHFHNLKKRDDRNSATAAYALFVELMDSGFDLNDALDEVVNRGYLTQFFGRKEFRDMFAEVFSYDNELLETGRQEGERKKALAIAKNLKDKNMPVAFIAEATGLTEQEIAEL